MLENIALLAVIRSIDHENQDYKELKLGSKAATKYLKPSSQRQPKLRCGWTPRPRSKAEKDMAVMADPMSRNLEDSKIP